MKFITIKESSNAANLMVMKSRLESEGIRCRLKDELTSQVLNYLPAMSVKLQVVEDDLETVIEILKEAGELETDTSKLMCPNCGSENVKVKRSLKNVLKICSVFLGAVITFVSSPNIFELSELKCKDCKHEFRKN